jgi:hypothetical protein
MENCQQSNERREGFDNDDGANDMLSAERHREGQEHSGACCLRNH